MIERNLACIPPKPKVLIVVAPKGILEVYTNRHMRILIAKKLRGLPETTEAYLKDEEYLELGLPKWAQGIYYPGLLRATDTIRLRTPAEEADVALRLALVQEARNMTGTGYGSRTL